MNEMKLFENPEFGAIRTVEVGGEPWLVGKDVAQALGYSDTSDALKRHVDPEDKLTRRFADSGQSREMYIINESGLYSLVLSSKLPGAKKFKRWVTAEVLPSIRKHGAYMTDSLLDALEAHPEAVPEYLNRLRSENARNRELTRRLRLALPKAEYYDAFVDPADCTNIRTTAKELGVPEKQFTRYLEEKKYLFRDKNRKLFPRAVKKSAGLFLVRDFYTERGKLGHYTLITPAGKRHFLERTDEILFE